jgi:hypothetical protein
MLEFLVCSSRDSIAMHTSKFSEFLLHKKDVKYGVMALAFVGKPLQR